jgi:hypothetical protein
VLVQCSAPVECPAPVQCPAPMQCPAPFECPALIQCSAPVQCLAPVECPDAGPAPECATCAPAETCPVAASCKSCACAESRSDCVAAVKSALEAELMAGQSALPVEPSEASVSLDAAVELLQWRLQTRRSGTTAQSAGALAAPGAPEGPTPGGASAASANAASADPYEIQSSSGIRSAGVSAEEALVMSWANLRWSRDNLFSSA